MKKVLVGGLAVVAVLGLSGCANQEVDTVIETGVDIAPVAPMGNDSLPPTPPPFGVPSKNETVRTIQDLQKESTKIQMDEALTKEQKTTALKDIQQRIKDVAREATQE